MMRANEELGMIPLRVLLVRYNLAWAARIINYDESRLPWVVMYGQMACGRRRRGSPHQRWSDTLKAGLAFADLPTYQEWSLSIAAIGDNWKKHIKHFTSKLVMKFKNLSDNINVND